MVARGFIPPPARAGATAGTLRMNRLCQAVHVCRCSRNGGPQTCLPAACGLAQAMAQYYPSSSTQAQDPHKGPSLAGRATQGFLRGGLTRQAREEVERSRQGVPREVLMTQAMTIETRRAPASVVSSFPLWCKGGKRRRGVPRHQAKVPISVQRDPRPAGQQDGGHRGAQDGVTTRPFRRRRPLLSG